MGTRLGDKHPTRFRRVQGELNFEEIPSSVQDSEILGSWMRTKHKWKAMGSASYPEAGKGQRECIPPMVPCGLSPVARLYLAKNEAPEEEAAIGWCKLHHPWKLACCDFLVLYFCFRVWQSGPSCSKVGWRSSPCSAFSSPSQSIYYGHVSEAHDRITWPKVWPREINET